MTAQNRTILIFAMVALLNLAACAPVEEDAGWVLYPPGWVPSPDGGTMPAPQQP